MLANISPFSAVRRTVKEERKAASTETVTGKENEGKNTRKINLKIVREKQWPVQNVWLYKV